MEFLGLIHNIQIQIVRDAQQDRYGKKLRFVLNSMKCKNIRFKTVETPSNISQKRTTKTCSKGNENKI